MIKIDERIYRLWWEYLRRSKNYKEFCDWFDAKQKNKNLPLPDKYKEKGEFRHILLTFLHLRDIHSVSFKKWWNWKRKGLEQLTSDDSFKSSPAKVELFDDDTGLWSLHFDLCIKSFKDLHGKKPTMQEFKGYFPLWLKSGDLYPGMLYLMVNVSSGTTEEVLEAVERFIVRKRKDRATKNEALQKTRYLWPSTKLQFDKLERYLTVFDLRNKKPPTSWPKIMASLTSSANIQADERTFKLYLQKAKEIIKYVEHGYFPGPYDHTRARRVKAKKG